MLTKPKLNKQNKRANKHIKQSREREREREREITDKFNYLKSKAKRYKIVNTRTWRFIFLEH